MEKITKILFVENNLTNDNPMSTCYTIKCEKIKNINKDNVEVKYYNISSNEQVQFENFDIVLFGQRSIYLYKTYKNKEKEKLKTKFEEISSKINNKFFLIQDMHPKTYGSIDTLCSVLNEFKFNIIFTFFNNSEAKLIRRLTNQCKHYHLPHHINTDIFKIHDQNKYNNKDIDILLFGSNHPRHYPFRNRLFDLILKNKDKFNIYYIPYDSSNFNPDHCEIGLSKLLNRSKISVATKSRYDYLVGKYFEISSSGCLIAGDIPTDGYDLFKNNILELNNSMGDDEILSKITNCLNNYDEYIGQINYLKYVVDNQYNIDVYIEKLLSILLS